MLDRRAALMFAAIFCLWITSVAYGQEQDLKALKASRDLAHLKDSFTAEIDALNSRKLDATLTSVDDRMVLFGIFSPFPIEGKEGFRQAVQEYFDNYEQAVFQPIDPGFKIIGTTGVAWGHFRLATKLKDGPKEYSDGRYLWTYIQADGEWRIISMHYSLLQPLVK